MLVLKRNIEESIVIGENTYVTVIKVRGNSVWLGIAAPEDVEIDRIEVRDRKDRERRRK